MRQERKTRGGKAENTRGQRRKTRGGKGKTRGSKGETHAEPRVKNTRGQEPNTRADKGEKHVWARAENARGNGVKIRSGGKGEGPILCSASFLVRLALLKGEEKDCNAGYYRLLSTCNHNLVLIKFIFFSFDS